MNGYWIFGPEEEHIFWTPSRLPLKFSHARNTLIRVIGDRQCMTIDFSKFVHGDEWWKCGEPRGSTRDRDDHTACLIFSRSGYMFLSFRILHRRIKDSNLPSLDTTSYFPILESFLGSETYSILVCYIYNAI